MRRLAIPLVLLLAQALAAAAPADSEVGRAVYDRWCARCHGAEGDGNGPAAPFLMPRPRDFTLGVYKYKSTEGTRPPSDQDIGRMVAEGMPGTAMPGWKDVLGEGDRQNVVAYVKTFSDIFEAEEPGPPISLAGRPADSPQLVAVGKDTYRKAKCHECHGDAGKGNPSKKLKDDWGAPAWPRNLTRPWTFRGGSDVKDIYTRITVGIPGMPMPAFGDAGKPDALTEWERWSVAHYVASLADPARRPSPAANVAKASYRAEEIPADVTAQVWLDAPAVSFRLAPQIIAAERLFTPVVDQVTVRALYNDREVALLVEWDDPTPSRPGDRVQAALAPGEMFEDAVAAQFPVAPSEGPDKPYFGHGDAANPVNVWYWRAGRAGAGSAYALFDMRGMGSKVERDPAPSGLSASGEYTDGTWRVVFRRSRLGDTGDVPFESGRLIPVAFANWDGSNGEKGSKHTLTPWVWLWLEPAPSLKTAYVPTAVALLLAGGLLGASARARRAGGRREHGEGK
ncbi:MAG: c-type cytochrome [Proteobacteria bacterium]|nr:c-type cytochrome [Pseudomonadota bacterium]